MVSTLSDLTVTRSGSSASLSSLTVENGESVSLTATGTYWSRAALRSGAGGVTWSVSGGVGAITQDGVFTANGTSPSGTITASAGGLTRTITVRQEGLSVHTDVPEDHWAYAAVEYCYEKGIVSGVSATEFGANHSICRRDFALMLYGAMGRPAVTGTPPFSDVDPDALLRRRGDLGQRQWPDVRHRLRPLRPGRPGHPGAGRHHPAPDLLPAGH